MTDNTQKGSTVSADKVYREVIQEFETDEQRRAYIESFWNKGIAGLEGPDTTNPADINRWVQEYFWARDFQKMEKAKRALVKCQQDEKDREDAGEYDYEAPDLRGALIDMGYDEIPGFEFLNDLSREDLTDLCIALSLCPIHRVDWAICFDDQPDDCAQVRLIYPTSHDT